MARSHWRAASDQEPRKLGSRSGRTRENLVIRKKRSMKLKMAHQELELGGKYLGTLREANDLLDDPAALQARMAEDGYLLLRGLHNKEKVLAARRLILENLDANGQIDRSYPLMEGVVKEGARGAFLGGSKPLTRNQTFLDLVESPEVMGFFAHFLQGDVLTYDYKWLRVV